MWVRKNVLFTRRLRKIITYSSFVPLFWNLDLVKIIVFLEIRISVEIGDEILALHCFESFALLVILDYHRLCVAFVSPRSIRDFLNHFILLPLRLFQRKLFVNQRLILGQNLCLQIHRLFKIFFKVFWKATLWCLEVLASVTRLLSCLWFEFQWVRLMWKYKSRFRRIKSSSTHAW